MIQLDENNNISAKAIIDSVKERMDEQAEELVVERFKIVNRVRKGQVQRRKKVSDREGFTVRNGKVVKISAKERRNRSISQKRAAKKRKGKLSTSLRKRRISLRKASRLTNK